MHIEPDKKFDFSDLLIRPTRSKLSSRKDVDLQRSFTFLHSKQTYVGIPIIAANMDTVATMNMAGALKEFDVATALHKHYKVDELITFFTEVATSGDVVFYSLGILDKDVAKFEEVLEAVETIRYVCIDVANGYSERFVEFVTKFRKDHPTITIMCGNVVTADMTEELTLAGADIIKIGIGSGSVCTTRKVSGIGYPQASAVMECATAAHRLGGLICSDGGCTVPGDVVKAFALGSDFVMMGGMLAGHTECDGEIVVIGEEVKITEIGSYVTKQGKRFMKFYGMSSKIAMEKHAGGVADYRASEGKEVLIPFRGSVDDTIKTILGGVRSACTYTGSHTLKDLTRNAIFVQVSQTHNTIFGDE